LPSNWLQSSDDPLTLVTKLLMRRGKDTEPATLGARLDQFGMRWWGVPSAAAGTVELGNRNASFPAMNGNSSVQPGVSLRLMLPTVSYTWYL
jgi:hypothetical protein